jgi:hypothetical protein
MIDTKDLYKTLIDTRNFEISLFWQRSNYFLVLNSGLALGFFNLDKSIYALGLALFGLVASLLWFAVCLGGKFWQTRWEQRLLDFEKEHLWHLQFFAATPDRHRNDVDEGLRFHKAGWLKRLVNRLVLWKPSVSYSMIWLSAIFVFAWVGFIAAFAISDARLGTAPRPTLSKPGAAENANRFAAIIDAGSTGSRLSIFKLQTSPGNDVDVEQVGFFRDNKDESGKDKEECPLTKLKGSETQKTCDCLNDLLKRGKEKVRNSLGTDHKIPLWLMATAGVRRQEYNNQVQILTEADKCLANAPGYEWQGARVITGVEEGVYAWLAANQHLHALKTNVVADTRGIVEIGGQSAQVAFRVWGPTRPAPARGEIISVPLPSGIIHVYAISDFLGIDALLKDKRFGDPDKREEGKHPRNGCANDGDPELCLKNIKIMINAIVNPILSSESALEPPKEMKFSGLSNLQHIVGNIGLADDSTLEKVKEEAFRVCRDDKSVERAYALRNAKEQFKPNVCFTAIYSPAVTNLFKVPLANVQPLDNKANAQFELGWPLGAMIYENAISAGTGR